MAGTWPVPPPVKILYGAALVTIALVLIMVVREKRAYRRTRPTMVTGALGPIILDALMLTMITVMVP